MSGDPQIDGHPIRIDDAPIPLADDSSIPLDADPIGLSEPLSPEPRVCPGCGQVMAATAVVCIDCGFDVRTNTVHVGPEPKGPKCFNCGYSLYGIKVKNCPECGAATAGRERVLAVERKNARDSAREEYLKPLYMFAGGIAISVVMTMLLAGGFSAGVLAVAGLLIKYAIYVPFGVLVFLACCLIWIGFNAPVHLTALRLAGIYAVTDAVAILVAFIPLPIIPMLILVTVYVGLLQDMLELDLIDAAAVGLITFIARQVMLMVLAAYVGKWLGI